MDVMFYLRSYRMDLYEFYSMKNQRKLVRRMGLCLFSVQFDAYIHCAEIIIHRFPQNSIQLHKISALQNVGYLETPKLYFYIFFDVDNL
jgi:hypothetical protein